VTATAIYTVTASNGSGNTAVALALAVTSAPVAPTITTPPSVQSVTVGDPVTFTVTATGTAPLSYQWYQGTTPVGGNNPFYAITSAQLMDAGNYTVTVSNGTAPAATSSAVALTVNAAPVAPSITTSPTAQTVTEGQPATFTVAATGSTPLTYVWQKNGVNVGSNSASYTLALPLLADAGSSITVTVTNGAGVAPSTPVTLMVNPLLVNLGSSMPLNLTPIPAGTFTMGSPSSDPDYQSDETHHQVTVSQNFYMGTYLVTQAQWTQVMGANPSHFQTPANLQRPVEGVSYTDITTADTGFLAKLNQNAIVSPGIPSGYVFRLPTEAEWEYACRAGTTTRFYWGDYSDANTTINFYAWYSVNDGATTMPVGELLPNDWGLYDMAGNVWEWCQDWYAAYDSGPDTDPAGPTTGSNRVVRGGSWGDTSSFCRSAYRDYDDPVDRDIYIGFRVVLAPPRTP
jgi:formylglycine-generating enzyme required for sulfatase activity